MANTVSTNISGNEGNPGANGSATFRITRTDNTITQTYMYGWVGGGTISSNDLATPSNPAAPGFGPSYRAVTIPIGSLFVDVVVPFEGDTTVEANETFSMNVYETTSGTAYVGEVIGTIINDDVVATTLSIGNVTANEGDTGTTLLSFTVTRSDTTGSPTATYTIGNGAGANPTDSNDFAFTGQYPQTGTVTFAAGSATATVIVPVRGDSTIENSETFAVTLSSPANATIATGTGIGTIANDDGNYTVTSPTEGEGNDDSRRLTFTVTRSGPTDFATTLYAQPVSGTATADSDFSSAVIPVAFAIGQTTATVAVPILGDTTVEPNEYFTLNIYNTNSGGVLSNLRASGTGGLVNDDSAIGGPANGGTTTSSNPGQPGTLTGSAGNDVFVVRNPGDVVVEGSNGGTDTVYASVSYALNGGAFVETLSTQTQQGTENINLTGNFYAQQVVGNFGNNVLNGNGGADTLIGLKGNDTYAIADANAVIVENGGEGHDIVYTSVSYALTGTAEIEELSFTTQSGTENLNLIGNGFNQNVVGNFGNNVLNGNGGIDTLIGLKGDDVYVVGNAASVVVENGGEGTDIVYSNVSYTLAAGASIETLSTQVNAGTDAINLKGNEVAQTVVGNNGANLIDGGAGSDTLHGLAGADTFAFSTALGTANVDTLADFGNGADKLQLSASVFTGLTTGALAANAFTTGAAATTADHRIVYDQATGHLFFDADGSGAGAAMLFATVTAGTAITADMISVV